MFLETKVKRSESLYLRKDQDILPSWKYGMPEIEDFATHTPLSSYTNIHIKDEEEALVIHTDSSFKRKRISQSNSLVPQVFKVRNNYRSRPAAPLQNIVSSLARHNSYKSHIIIQYVSFCSWMEGSTWGYTYYYYSYVVWFRCVRMKVRASATAREWWWLTWYEYDM